ncbi:MAG: hypothetical protein JW807_06290 [Spirochaetes bacterium]|nr:hypothetical protein [Spirochaetota bacterium]
MKGYLKYWFSVVMMVCLPLTIVSCQQSSKTSILPLPVAGSGGGGGGGGDVSATAVMLNGITRAFDNYASYYTAFNNAGYGMAVWNSETGSGSHVVYSIYDPGTGEWSAPREFADNVDSYNYRVASNGAGFMVVYGRNSMIYARTWSGGVLGALVNISGETTNAYGPVAASSGSGYCAVWRQYDTDRYNLYAAVHNGTSWGSPAQLIDTTDYPDVYTISTNGTGYCVTWRENSRLFAAVYAPSSWSAGTIVDSGAWPSNYSVAGNASRYVIVFQTGSDDIYANIYNAGWGGASLIESSGGPAQAPRIASNGTTFCSVWHQHDGSTYSIYASTYNGTDWSGAETIDNGIYEAFSPDIASNGSGYCAVWYQYDGGTSYKIYANRYTTSWQGAELLNPLNTEGSDQPYIYGNSSGYMAHWNETVAGESRIGSSVHDGTAWSAMALVDPEYHSIYNPRAYPFNGGYGFAYSYQETAGPGLMANVYRGGAWVGAADISGGLLRGTSTAAYQTPVLYRAGSSTIAVWMQYDRENNGSWKLYASVKSGSSWGAPLLISARASEYSAAYNGTDFCVVWTAFDNTKGRDKLLGVIYSGGSWGSEVLLDNDINGRYSTAPRVAGNGSTDGFCVAWAQYDGSSYYALYVNIYDTSSSTWAVPSAVMDNNTGWVDAVRVMAGDTNYCLTFNQNSRSYARIYDGSWSAAEELDGANQFWPNMYNMTASGDQFIVANSRSSDIYVNVYDGSSWSGMTVQDETQSNSAYSPAVAGDGAGGFCLTWYEYKSYTGVMTRIYDGLAWGDAMSANYFDEYLAPETGYEPRVASNGSGYAVAFYKPNDFDTMDLCANVYEGGAGLWIGAEILEDSISSVTSSDYSIGSNGTGYGVAWRQWNEDGVRMAYGSAFDGSGWERTVLSNGESDAGTPELVGAGSGYVAAWLQADAEQDLVSNLWSEIFE